MTLRIAGAIVAIATVVVAMVWIPAAVPASGDGPGSTGAPTGGTAAGGGGGLTTPGDVPQTSELWSATIGGTTRTGLDTDSIGSILYRGTKQLIQVPTIAGESRAQEVCQGFPEISVSQSGASNAPGGSVKLRLDFAECVVRVDELTRTNVGVFAASGAGLAIPTTLAWPTQRTVEFRPIAWRASAADAFDRADDEINPFYWRSRLIGSIEDAVGFDLTRVEINRRYGLRIPLRSLAYSRDCRAASIFPDHILWFEDECTGNQSLVAGQMRAWARGRFHAEVVREGTSLNRDSRHTIYLHLEGSTDGDVTKTCTFSPYGIRHLEATFARTNPLFWLYPGGWGVRVDCRHSNWSR